MEPLNQKSLERAVSQKALQMGSSFPCQICVVGFLCGVCLTSLFLATLTSFGTFEFGGFSFSTISEGASAENSSSEIISTNCSFKPIIRTERIVDSLRSEEMINNESVSLLYSVWSALLTESESGESDDLQRLGVSTSRVPNAPHLENCKLKTQVNERLDKRAENETYPPWTSWKGLLAKYPAAATNEHQATSEGAYAPWITGSDEENYPLTRKVQRDIWMHQHPLNCRDPSVKFLVADWERLPGFGIGAQIAGMCGLLAIAINEKRVLVTNYYNRADHDGCKDSSRSSWSCYFFPETSQECRDRAFELMGSEEAWKKGTIKAKESYNSKQIWAGPTPRTWGDPWSHLQPTTDINGSLVAYHRKMDRRWWRAQAVRYLMRFQTEYTCGLLNVARHTAFGKEAANMVVTTFEGKWPKDAMVDRRSDIEEFVWSSHKPWMPRPLLSMHVRMGDKACEMKVVEFEEYMGLAGRIRKRFPQLKSVWLSTEMQEVIDKSRSYRHWDFYYTNVTRQVGNMTMATYETSLGRETSTNYPLVNFLMASEADFFVGALGSTWCFLIDGFSRHTHPWILLDSGIPHKEAALMCCDEVDPVAKSIGAINCIIRRPADGKLFGFNTDYVGAISAIEEGLKGSHNNSGKNTTSGSALAGRLFVVIGAGGASKALAYGAKQRGARLVIANRTYDRARELADIVGGDALSLDDLPNIRPEDGMILANTTSIGMQPKVDDTPISKHALRSYSLVFDAIYTPRVTRLLREAAECGVTVVSGLEMFIGQAYEQFEKFTGLPAPKELFRKVMENHS